MESAIRDVEAGKTITMKDFEKELEKLHPGHKDRMKKQREKEAKKIKNSSRKRLKKKLHKQIDGIKSKYILKILLNDIMPDSLE